ncbi:MAG: hypothetical protein CMQ40_10185 [Gammaproteobacteria bacterium]|nr:hypothetical protein [Gammaproteobacteria bacterium]
MFVDLSMESLAAIGLLITLFFFFNGPRPRIDLFEIASSVPKNLSHEELVTWLSTKEGKLNVIPGAESVIEWAGEPKQTTKLCILYIHGFSATRQEIAPTVSEVAKKFKANVVYARLAGHGLNENQMEATAEDWMQTALESWDLATRVGHEVIIIATSTGAPISIWLQSDNKRAKTLKSLIFVSPNFRIRIPIGFLLTMPHSYKWIPWLIGKKRRWEPENELVKKYWSSSYDTRAIIEMQKVVDWAEKYTPKRNIPLATFYVENDPTINHKSAIDYHNRWPSKQKELIKVDSGHLAPKHIFVGNISNPEKNDWFVQKCCEFIENKR